MALDLDQFTERAAIREFCGGQTRFAAETGAAREQGLERWQAIRMAKEAEDAQRGGRSAGVGAGAFALARQRGEVPVSTVQPEPEEANRPVPVGQPQAGRDRGAMLALRLGSGREVQR